MQFLVFHLDRDRYGLAARSIERVLPLLACKGMPGTPPWVVGLFDYHGTPVPVLDLSMRAVGQPAPDCLDTRLVLVRYRAAGNALLGLVAERVTGIERVDPSLFCDAGIAQEARYLGKVATPAGMLQLIEPDYLLDEAMRAVLFPVTETPC